MAPSEAEFMSRVALTGVLVGVVAVVFSLLWGVVVAYHLVRLRRRIEDLEARTGPDGW